MPLIINTEEIRMDGTTSVTISDIVTDEDSGGYLRTVAFYTDPIDAPNRRPDLIVKLYGDKPALLVQTPTLSF